MLTQIKIAEEKQKYEQALGKEVSLIDFLQTKCVQGNEKLYNAWEQMKGLSDDARQEADKKYNQAIEKLDMYCSTLKAHGFDDCLYIKNGTKTKGCLVNLNQPGWFCRACPASQSRKYWEEEMMSLPKP